MVYSRKKAAGSLHDANLPPYRGLFLLVSLPEDTEKIDKEVDKVEIECERTEDGKFLRTLVSIFCAHAHLLDLL